MSATKDFCKRQLKRLAAAPKYFPQTVEGQTEVLNALMRCKSDERAAEIMTALLEQVEIDSVVGSIVYLNQTLRNGDETFRPLAPTVCDSCSDTGWHSIVGRDGNDYSTPCTCPEGQKRGAPTVASKAKPLGRMERADFQSRAAGDAE